MAARFNEKIDQWVANILRQTKNIATEIELREQAKVALNLFIEADMDGSETLSFEELKALCDMAGLPMENNEEDALIQMDKDDSGTLDIEEWVLWWVNRISTLPNPVKQQEAIARNTFKKFDADGSGCLDASELGGLTQSLGADFTEEELAEALAEVDSDGSGVIEVEEFVAWWTQRAAANRSNSSLISLKMRKLAMKAAQVFSTDIFAAAWAGDLDLVKAFLVGEPRLAQAADSSEHGEGWTALQYAAYRGHAELVSALLESKADANRTNDLGFSALFYAAQRGHIGICRTLLEHGADPSVTGMCGLPQPLGQDGPPSSGESSDPAALQVFMCPVEHCADYPQLRDLFQSMSAKCSLPQVPDYDKVRAELQLAAGTLSLDLQQPQKAISQLPVKHWEAKLRLDMQMDTELVAADVYADIVASGLTISLSVPAAHPKQPQSFPSIALDRVWVKKVQFLCALHKLKRLQLLLATPEALRGAWAEFCACYVAIDQKYRAALNVPDFMYLLIKKCPDKKNTKDLRHSLRASIEQVTIRNSAAPAVPPVEASGVQKASASKNAPSSKSSAATEKAVSPNAVDVKDPIALVNAAITELFARKAAAESAAAALAEQLRREQAQEAKRKQRDAGSKQGDQEEEADEPELLVMPGSKASKAASGKSKASSESAGPAGAESTAGGKEAGADGRADKAPEKGWAWAEDSRAGYPTVSLQLAAVSPWGAGDFSSTVSVAIVTTKRNR